MPPVVALSISLAVIAWLFYTDRRWRRGSPALFVPWLWLIIVGSRPLGYWIGASAQSTTQGSPFDRLVGLLLILSAALILLRRKINWLAVIADNKALLLTFLYLLVSTSWSYDSSVSLTRWIRAFSGVLMALVFLSDERPLEAIRMVFVRCAYVLMPLSVVTSKYYPDVGRLLSKSWENMYTGLTLHKNELGLMVFVFGLMVIWDWVEMRRQRVGTARPPLFLNHLVLFLCGSWLIWACGSQTARICLFVAVIGLWGGGRLVRLRYPRQALIRYAVTTLCVLALVQVTGLWDNLLMALGRDPTLTGRTDVWEAVRDQPIDPLIGAGFYTFWDGPHAPGAIEGYIASGFKTAHNGYLEMSLDGGLVALALLIMVLASGVGRAAKRLLEDSLWGRICFVLVILVLPYNWSESAFFRDNPIWYAFLLVTIQCHMRSPQKVREGNPQAVSAKPAWRRTVPVVATPARPAQIRWARRSWKYNRV